jgi:enoyl-CoA hydratase
MPGEDKVVLMNRYSKYEYLSISVVGGLASVTINRPDRDNAFDDAGHNELASIVTDLEADDEVKAVLVTAAGPVFSAGGLPEYIEGLIDDPVRRERAHAELRREMHSLVDFDKPIVTAITGPANGAALTLALLSDIVIVEKHVRFRDPHVLLGMVAGDNAVVAWTGSVGIIKAKRYLLTGDSFSAEEAERLGLITEVVDEGSGIARAKIYAERLAAGPSEAIRYTKRALNQRLRMALPAYDEGLALQMLTLMSGLPREALLRLREGGVPLMPRDRKVTA